MHEKIPIRDLARYLRKGIGMKTEPLTIVLADDESNIRMSLRTVFRRAQHRVVVFDNGADALTYFENADPLDHLALVSDIVMPQLSGLELIRAVRRLMPDIPIIAMTGYGDKPMVTELLRAGCDDFLDKPFEPDVIISTLDRIVETRTTYAKNDRVLLRAIESMEREFGLELSAFRVSQSREQGMGAIAMPVEPEHPFSTEKDGDWLIIKPFGNMTAEVARALKEVLEEELERKQRHFRFDMSHVQDVDALAISVLCALSQEVQDAGEGAVEMCSVAPAVNRMFAYLHLENEFGLAS